MFSSECTFLTETSQRSGSELNQSGNQDQCSKRTFSFYDFENQKLRSEGTGRLWGKEIENPESRFLINKTIIPVPGCMLSSVRMSVCVVVYMRGRLYERPDERPDARPSEGSDEKMTGSFERL